MAFSYFFSRRQNDKQLNLIYDLRDDIVMEVDVKKILNRKNESIQEMGEESRAVATPDAIISPKRMYKCKVCDKSFEVCLELAGHMTAHRPRKQPLQKVIKSLTFAKPAAVCYEMGKNTTVAVLPKCNMCFNLLATVLCKSYFIIAFSGTDHKCPECEKSFTAAIELAKHMSTHRTERQPVGKMCGICSFGPMEADQLSRHLCMNFFQINCQYCPTSFKSTIDLQNHLNKANHVGMHLYKCGYCKMIFCTKSLLEFHQNSEFTHKENRDAHESNVAVINCNVFNGFPYC